MLSGKRGKRYCRGREGRKGKSERGRSLLLSVAGSDAAVQHTERVRKPFLSAGALYLTIIL